MGKKYIIELEDKPFHRGDGNFLYKVKGFNSLVFDMTGINKLILYTEPDLEQVRKEAYEKGRKDVETQFCSYDACKNRQEEYQRGLADAWEAVKKLARMDTDTSESITGYFGLHNIMHNLTASEVIKKIHAYEQAQKEKELEQKEIKVGDEVEWMGDKYVVIYVMCEAKKADLISCKFGSVCENVAFSALGKTGRHFPEIAEVLRKMRENND